MQQQEHLKSSAVWLFSAAMLTIYGILGLTNTQVPGLADLIQFTNTTKESHLYLAALLTIFIEGLYFFSNFFPGSTLIVIIVILSQSLSILSYLGIILITLLGWILSGGLNIIISSYLIKNSKKLPKTEKIENNLYLTWFPAFRANAEVSQVISGHNPIHVLFNTSKIKIFVSIGGIFFALLMSKLVDLQNISNQESHISLIIVAGISYLVGFYKLYKYENTRSHS